MPRRRKAPPLESLITEDWKRRCALGGVTQRSHLFYIIANVGPSKEHRPLAIAYRQHAHGCRPDTAWTGYGDPPEHTILDCVQLVAILTEPDNRVAIEAEKRLAETWYTGSEYRDPEPAEIKDSPPLKFNFSGVFKPDKKPELPCASAIREFPFISTCLRLGLNTNNTHHTREGDVEEQPLGTIFRDDKMEYGMVVLDISDLDDVRLGIYTTSVTYYAWVYVWPDGEWDPAEGLRPTEEPEAILGRSKDRALLSGSQYVKERGATIKFYTGNLKRPVVELDAVRSIWPPAAPTSEGSHIQTRRKTRTAHSDSSLEDQGILDRAVETVVQDTLRNEVLDREKHLPSISHPDFQERLFQALEKDPLRLGPSQASADLLCLAFAGHLHLNWVAYKNLSYEIVTAALQSAALTGATALSLCVDRINGSPMSLFEALSQSDKIREVSFLQEPTRTNDDLTSQLFAQLCLSPSASSVFRTTKINLTCAYSAPFRKKFWLPNPTRSIPTSPPAQSFPVQHMFVRTQIPSPAGDERKKFRPRHFFLGDSLLTAERFAVGLLEYFNSVPSDKSLCNFSCAPKELASYHEPTYGLTIRPICAENWAIRRSSVEAGGEKHEGWPLVRDIKPDSWIVILSYELWRGPGGSLAPYIRYGLLRARQRIPVLGDVSASPDRVDEFVQPEYVEVVGGLKEFLRDAAPEVDANLLEKPLETKRRELSERRHHELAPGMSDISEVDDGSARSILKDFLLDAPFVKENVRAAMKAKPQERDWYPNILQESEPQGDQRPVRNTEVFGSSPEPVAPGRPFQWELDSDSDYE